MLFSPDELHGQLAHLSGREACWVAYSGGMDSHVLLHALASLRGKLQCAVGAIHINHGLHGEAGEWETHCRGVCAGLNVPYVSRQVDARPAAGESPEAAAREARYQALAAWLPGNHCLLTAQHQDDQAETLLLQLLRGAGVRGLAAMPARTVFGSGDLLRPLLQYTRSELKDYADGHQLQWIDDPSNADTSLDRNFLRHQVMPVLQQRWPSLAASLSRSAAHCAEASRLMELLGESDLAGIVEGQDRTIALERLSLLPAERQHNALRHWIRSLCHAVPSAAVFSRIVNDVLPSRPDAEPCVRWGHYEVRRYRNRLYLLPQLPASDARQVREWEISSPLSLPEAGGVLSVLHKPGQGISAAALQTAAVRVRYRQGGESCRPAGRQHTHSLKKLFQEQGIPPWERPRIPLIYLDDKLAAVAGLWVCEPFQALAAEPGLEICWTGVRQHP